MKAPYENLATPYTKLNGGSCALLVIDTQNDYGDTKGAYPMPDLAHVIPVICGVIDLFRGAELPIVHVVRLYKEDGSNVDPCRRWQLEKGELRAVIPGTWGSQLVASTNPTGAELDAEALLAGEMQELTPREYVLYKPRFSAFHATSLEDFLSARGLDSVVIIGITFPNCVLAAQLSATDRDYRVGLVPDACTQVNDEGLLAMQNKGVQLMTVDDLRELLSRM
ncbi:MAG: cysteine hydrolase [Actinobacteria bacterium]|jgi:nicotinamidase-related amidase|nr:MAG: cysteine hydrolase [Actinomycetota bacterium]